MGTFSERILGISSEALQLARSNDALSPELNVEDLIDGMTRSRALQIELATNGFINNLQVKESIHHVGRGSDVFSGDNIIMLPPRSDATEHTGEQEQLNAA